MRLSLVGVHTGSYSSSWPSLDPMIVSLRLIILFCWRSKELSLINIEKKQREAEGEMQARMHTTTFRQTYVAIDLNRRL